MSVCVSVIHDADWLLQGLRYDVNIILPYFSGEYWVGEVFGGMRTSV